jgi:hypothetical protein
MDDDDSDFGYKVEEASSSHENHEPLRPVDAAGKPTCALLKEKMQKHLEPSGTTEGPKKRQHLVNDIGVGPVTTSQCKNQFLYEDNNGVERTAGPLRPGDTIQYYLPIFCAGDPRGLRTATVISTDPSAEYMIRLDNTDILPNSTLVKRLNADESFYFPINVYALKKRELDMDKREPFLRLTEQVGACVDRNIAKFQASMKEQGMPTDLVRFHSRRPRKANDKLQPAKERENASKESQKDSYSNEL